MKWGESLASIRHALAWRRMANDVGEGLTVCIATVVGHELPPPLRIERVQLSGTLGLVAATVWCRRSSRAHAGSPVPWNSEAVQSWTVEVHGMYPDRDGEGRVPIVFSTPCGVDPRTPSAEADAAIMTCIARVALHEAMESVELDGEALDPHEHGELGLDGVAEAWRGFFSRRWSR